MKSADSSGHEQKGQVGGSHSSHPTCPPPRTQRRESGEIRKGRQDSYRPPRLRSIRLPGPLRFGPDIRRLDHRHNNSRRRRGNSRRRRNPVRPLHHRTPPAGPSAKEAEERLKGPAPWTPRRPRTPPSATSGRCSPDSASSWPCPPPVPTCVRPGLGRAEPVGGVAEVEAVQVLGVHPVCTRTPSRRPGARSQELFRCATRRPVRAPGGRGGPAGCGARWR